MLPEPRHLEVVANHKKDQFAVFRSYPESIENRSRQLSAGLGVSLERFPFADVVQEEDEVKQGGSLRRVKNLGVLARMGRLSSEYLVQLSYRIKRVDIRRVAMVVLVLNKARQTSEFGYKTLENAELVHPVDDWENLAGGLEDR